MGVFLLRGSHPVLAGFTLGRGSALPRVLLVRCTSSCVLPHPTGDACPRTPSHRARRIKAASFLRSSQTPALEPPQAPHEFMPPGSCQSCGFAGTGRGISPFDEPVCHGLRPAVRGFPGFHFAANRAIPLPLRLSSDRLRRSPEPPAKHGGDTMVAGSLGDGSRSPRPPAASSQNN